MLFPANYVEIYIFTQPVDGRFGFDRLAGYVKSHSGLDPYSGKLFLFVNRSITRAKLIFFDGSGSCIHYKRLEVGRFQLPVGRGKPELKISSSDLLLFWGV